MVNLNKIKELTKGKGWSMTFLCGKIGISYSYFSE